MRILLILFAILFFQAVHGQKLTRENHQQLASAETGVVKKKLGLDAAQAGQMEAVNTRYYKLRSELPTDLSEKARTEKIDAMNREKEESLRKILSNDQWQKYQKLVSDRKARMKPQTKKTTNQVP